MPSSNFPISTSHDATINYPTSSEVSQGNNVAPSTPFSGQTSGYSQQHIAHDRNAGAALRQQFVPQISEGARYWLQFSPTAIAVPNISQEHFNVAYSMAPEVAKNFSDHVVVEGFGLGHLAWGSKPANLIEKYNAPFFSEIENMQRDTRFAQSPDIAIFDAGEEALETAYIASFSGLIAATHAHHDDLAECIPEAPHADTERMVQEQLIPFMRSDLDTNGTDDYPVLAAIILGYGKKAGEHFENRDEAATSYQTAFHAQIEAQMNEAIQICRQQGHPAIPFVSPMMFGVPNDPESIAQVGKNFSESQGMYHMFHQMVQQYPGAFDGSSESWHRLITAAVLATIFPLANA